MTDYTLESLIKIFEEHAKIAEENNKKDIKTWLLFNKNDPIPDHIENAFNISKALHVICQAIKDMQDIINKDNK